MSKTITVPTNSSVKFFNSQGFPLKATILRLRRYSISFEIYNPYSIVQLSEVLQDFKVRLNGRLIYEGDAVVSGLVNTGVLLVCEVTLSGGWKDVDFLATSEEGGSLITQFDGFVDDWKRAHHVSSDFKINVADMQNLLIGVKRWLEQIDLGIRSSDAEDRNGLEKQVICDIEQRVLQEIQPLMNSFEASTREVALTDRPAHKFYCRRQIHPLVMCSPFAYRIYSKPLGYAGDYEMVNMMIRDPYEGSSLYAKMLNRMFLDMDPVKAHRNRIDYLVKMLRQESERKVLEGGRVNILNLGCGPAQEIQRFVANEEISDQCDFTLLDFNRETLDYTSKVLSEIRQNMGRSTRFNMIESSVHELLKQASKGKMNLKMESYDIVYCAGLFDYLSQKVCKKLVELFTKLLCPGGMLITTNVASTNPRIGWMEFLAEWNLVYRNDWEMLDLIPLDGTILETNLERDETGVNLFLEIRKVAIDPMFGQKKI